MLLVKGAHALYGTPAQLGSRNPQGTPWGYRVNCMARRTHNLAHYANCIQTDDYRKILYEHE
jgi:hypothetical protein